jgi:excisionase family DNA binding protein
LAVSHDAKDISLGTAQLGTRPQNSACQPPACHPAFSGAGELFQFCAAARKTDFSSNVSRYPMEIQPLFYSKQTSARILGISERTVHVLIAQKLLGAMRVGRRVLIAREELERFAQQGTCKKR